MNAQQEQVYYSAFGQRLSELVKEATMQKSAAGIAEEAAGKLAPGLFRRFGSAFGAGARNAKQVGELGSDFKMAPPAMSGLGERLGYGMGNTAPGAWAHSHPGTAGAIGAGLGGMGLAKGYDAARDSGRRSAIANMSFGNRLAAALQLMTNPEGVANKLY